MCGIAGIVDPEGASRDTLGRMCDALAHRGPDDADLCVWEDQGVGLGHRRLSIIDLSPAGRNPMGNEDGTVWVVHNGEIYNYRELRRELEAAGHRFRSNSDTEVIVHAYEQWGEDHVERLRGMFAYALYDRRAASMGGASMPRVLLVRDRLGIKPLFYSWDDRRLLFASEPKAIFAVPGFDRTPDRSALADFLTYLYVPTPKTAYARIRKVSPGEILVFDGSRLEGRRYWDVKPDASPAQIGVAEAASCVRELLEDSVRAHLVSDVPVGLFLSGGIDSSTIAALATSVSDDALRAYSIGFDVAEHSETKFARLVAARFDLGYREWVVGVGSVREALDRVGDAYDEPFGDGSAVPTMRVSELASDEGKVVLSGDGGDELFGGYGWYRRWSFRQKVGFVPLALRRGVFGPLAKLAGSRSRRWLSDLALDPFRQYARLLELFSPEEKRGLLGPSLQDELEGYDDYWHFRRYWREELDPLTRMQYLDLKTYLPDDILTKVDRASMAVGLEVRPPFLDHRLVEAVFALPASVRLPGGEPKGLLKRAMGPVLPKEVVERPKKGFSAPWDVWMGELDRWASGYLRDGAAVQAGILRPEPLSSLDGYGRGARTWSLLLLERWCRENL